MADDALELENIFNNGIGHHVTMFPTKNNNTSTTTSHVLPKGRRLIPNSRIKTIKKKKAISSKHPKSGMTLSSSHNKKDKEQPETKEYICHNPSCGKVFLDRNSYRKHIITHGEKQYICQAEGCGKRFLDNSKLKRHMLVHTGEKPYKCELCNKRFSLDFNLRTHLRIHTGEKPYVCSFKGCNKRFSQSSNLSAHEKTHLLPSNTPFTAVNASSNGLNVQNNNNNIINTNDISQSGVNGAIMLQKNECAQLNGGICVSKGMDVIKKKKFFKVIRPHYECGSGFNGVQKPKQLVILDRQKYEEEQEEKLREKMRMEEERKRLEQEMLERQERERLEREEKEREEREQKEREEREAREKERLENLERLKLLYNKDNNNDDDDNVDVNINGSDTDINSQLEFLIPYYLTKDYIKETQAEYFQ